MKLADLWVKLGLKDDSFQKGISTAQKKTSKLGSALKKLGGVIAAAFAVKKVFQFGKAAVEAANVQIQAEKKLAQAIKSNGKAVESTLNDYKSFASSIQKVTTVGDEATLQLLQLAETMQSDAPKEAAQGAIGLAKAYGIDMNSALKMVVLAQKGEYTMLQRYIPELRSATTEAEKHAIVQKAMADGFDIAKEEANSGLGPMVQLKNAWGDLTETIGKWFMPIIQKVAKWLTGITERINSGNGVFGQFTQRIKEFFKQNNQIGDMLKRIGSGYGKMWKKQFKVFFDVTKSMAEVFLALINYFIDLYNRSEKFRIGIGAIKWAFKSLWSVSSLYFDTVSKGFSTLADWIKSGFKKDIWTGFFNDTKKQWKDAFADMGENAKQEYEKAIYAEPVKMLVFPEFKKGDAEEEGEQAGVAFSNGFSTGLGKGGGAGMLSTKQDGVRATTDEERRRQADTGLQLFDVEAIRANSTALREAFLEQEKIFTDFKNRMAETVEAFAEDVVVGFAESIGEMLASSNVDPGELGGKLMGQVGKMLATLGKMMISFGIASEFFQQLMNNIMSGVGAIGLIAAGAALVVLGSGISKKASSMASGGSTSAASSGGSNTRTSDMTSSLSSIVYNIDLSGVLKGNDIKLSTDRTVYKNDVIG